MVTRLLIIAVCISSLAAGQAPQGISYQAIARNSTGAVISNQNISLRFSIRDATANGTVVYSETQNATTNALGLFSLFIGKGTAVAGTFSEMDWAGAPKFLQVEMDASGGNTYTDMGTQQMMSVPYSIYAEKAGNGFARMTQSQIDALIPAEGTMVFNTDTQKMQVYAASRQANILNDVYGGTSVGPTTLVAQYFNPLVSGYVTAIDILIKENGEAIPAFDIHVEQFTNYEDQTFPFTDRIPDFTWVTFKLQSPFYVTAGSPALFQISVNNPKMGEGYLPVFATNKFYPHGYYPVNPALDVDLVFRIHIRPETDSYGWQNLN